MDANVQKVLDAIVRCEAARREQYFRLLLMIHRTDPCGCGMEGCLDALREVTGWGSSIGKLMVMYAESKPFTDDVFDYVNDRLAELDVRQTFGQWADQNGYSLADTRTVLPALDLPLPKVDRNID